MDNHYRDNQYSHRVVRSSCRWHLDLLWIQEKMKEKIIVTYEHPPIPARDFDYSAVREGYDAGDPIGRGQTPEKAITDLLEQEDNHKDN
jgi:hypothetical protein